MMPRRFFCHKKTTGLGVCSRWGGPIRPGSVMRSDAREMWHFKSWVGSKSDAHPQGQPSYCGRRKYFNDSVCGVSLAEARQLLSEFMKSI